MKYIAMSSSRQETLDSKSVTAGSWFHRITLSACRSTVCGMFNPSALAVLRLIDRRGTCGGANRERQLATCFQFIPQAGSHCVRIAPNAVRRASRSVEKDPGDLSKVLGNISSSGGASNWSMPFRKAFFRIDILMLIVHALMHANNRKTR